MKSALISGSIIGVLSAAWLFLMGWLGYTTSQQHVLPIACASIAIPLLGIFLGVRWYKKNEKENRLNFFEGLLQSFKILLISGMIAGFLGVLYSSFIARQTNLQDFSERLFGALLVGILICFGVALTLMNNTAQID
ncbi:DUF4199 domain-containing protein [Mucilaginibacter litoreus]|uniref:DUF4199 domain-containing protein n=1 Tax=Mucilaginibacter litoreus TaxID=1048221 RepID=A0ABW3AWX1_9SPHI